MAEKAQACSTPLVEAARLVRGDISAMRKELEDVKFVGERENSARGIENAETKKMIEVLNTRIEEKHLDFSEKEGSRSYEDNAKLATSKQAMVGMVNSIVE